MRRRSHGLAWGWLMIMIITLMAFALAYAVLDGAIETLLDFGVGRTSAPQITTGRGYVRTAWDFAPIVVLFGAALALLGRAIWESAQPGR